MGGYIPFHKKLGCSVRFSWAALGLVEGGRKRANQRYRPRLRAFPPLPAYHWLLVPFSGASFGLGPGRELGRQPPARALSCAIARCADDYHHFGHRHRDGIGLVLPMADPISRDRRHRDASYLLGSVGSGARRDCDRAYLFKNATGPV